MSGHLAKHYILGMSLMVFLDEINIAIRRPSKPTTLPNVGGSYPINWRPNQNKKTEEEGAPPAERQSFPALGRKLKH